MVRPDPPGAVPLLPRRLPAAALLLLAPPLLPALVALAGETRLAVLPPASVTAEALARGPLMRVLLGQRERWELAGQGLRLRSADGRLLRQLAAEERLQLQASAAGVQAMVSSEGGAARRLPPQPAGLWLEPTDGGPVDGSFRLGQERYRGRLLIRPATDAGLQAINHLPLEIYLASVVGSEMPASWPQAALQAQAVAARTYALSQRRPAAPFDLKATVESQAYRGLASETDTTRAAVAATLGQVLMVQGGLIQAVFHSSSGGSTEDSGQVWSRQLPYLVSVPDFDDDSPVSRWRLRLEPEQLRRLFRETDGVRQIEVLARSGTGRIRRARVIGPAGSLDLSGGELRQRLGLRSTLARFELQPVTPPVAMGAIERALRRTWTSEPRGLAAGLRTLMEAASDPLPRPAPPPPPPALPATSSASTAAGGAAAAPPVWYALVVEGRGFGHGVGMSQWGAFAMARQGSRYDQILRHYYRGAEIVPYSAP